MSSLATEGGAGVSGVYKFVLRPGLGPSQNWGVSFMKKLFGKSEAHKLDLPHPNQMPIEEVWEEFCRIVPCVTGEKMIDAMRRPEFADTLAWLEPPSECPMAKGLLRAMVDYYRKAEGQMDDIALVYRPESVENWSVPSDESMRGLDGFVRLTRLPAKVLFQPAPDAEWVKYVISPV